MSISEIMNGKRAGATIAALMLLGMMAPATGMILSEQMMKGGNNDPNMADRMLAVQGMKCSNSNSGSFTDVSMHNCFSRCQNSDCAALIFDSSIDKCKIYSKCKYEPSDSTTQVMFIPNESSESDIEFPGAAVLYEVNTHTTCEQPKIGAFEDGVHLSDCMGICSNINPCKHMVFNDRGDPNAQKCKLYGDCTHTDTAVLLTLFTPLGDVKPPCDPPVTVVCKEGSTSEKCLEYCGPNLKAQAPPTPECGGVVYKCK